MEAGWSICKKQKLGGNTTIDGGPMATTALKLYHHARRKTLRMGRPISVVFASGADPCFGNIRRLSHIRVPPSTYLMVQSSIPFHVQIKACPNFLSYCRFEVLLPNEPELQVDYTVPIFQNDWLCQPWVYNTTRLLALPRGVCTPCCSTRGMCQDLKASISSAAIKAGPMGIIPTV